MISTTISSFPLIITTITSSNSTLTIGKSSLTNSKISTSPIILISTSLIITLN
jgi:hypothetical protein